ncbi:MAG: PAS domain S-box protein [Candidatus Competibacteraceae bacterium]
MSSTRPLRLWLELRIALAAMAPLALIAVLILTVLLPQLRADLEIRHQALAHAIAGQIEAHLLGPRRELCVIAEYIHGRGYRPAPFWFDLLDAHAGTGDVFAAIYLVAADDSVYAVGLPQTRRGQRDNLLGLDLSHRAFLREAREHNEVAWSETFLSAVTGRLAVSLAIPAAEHVLVGEIAIDQLSKFLNRSPAEAGMVTMILDRQGQVIAHSQAALSGQQFSLRHLPMVRDALAGRFVTGELTLDGQRFIGTPVNIPPLGWIVLVAQPRHAALQPLLSTWGALAAGALAALLLAVFVGWVLARGLARRIGRYADQAHAIAGGDYDQPWPITWIREFDNLAGDLERMSVAIRQRERDLATSEARYRSVIANAPVVLFQFDEHGVFTLSEGKGLTRLGLAAGEAVGQSLFELYRDYPEVCEYARRALGGEALQCALRAGDIFFEVSYSSVWNCDGRIQVTGVAMDITERQRAEDSLRHLARQDEEALRIARMGHWEFDIATGLFTFNDQYLALHGLTAETAGSYRMSAQKFACKYVHPEDAHLVSEYIRQAIESTDPRFEVRAEARLLRADGEPFDVTVWFRVEKDSQGRTVKLFGANQDITDRKQTEQKLRQSERQYRELVENANSIILRWNRQGEITFINEFGLKFFGYSPEELIGQHVVGTIVPSDESTGRDLRPLMDDICLHPERFERNINENMRRDGERVWVSWANKAVLNDQGQVVEVFSVGSDITDRKRAEAESARLQALLQSVILQSPVPMTLVLPDGTISLFSESCRAILGGAEESRFQARLNLFTLEKTWLDYDAEGAQIPILELPLALALQGKATHGREIKVVRQDGTEYWILVDAVPVYDDHNVIIAGFLIFIDITARKRAEAELHRYREHLEELVAERTAELRQAMDQLVQAEKLAALGHLVAGIAHELNTPLGNTRVVASALAEDLRTFAAAIESGTLRRSQVDAFLKRGGEAVDLLERNAARAADLIGHFKQVAVDQTSVRRRRFDLRRTVEELLITLKPQFKHTAHRLELDIAPGLELDSYPGPLEQVIANLVSNSLIHGFTGGEAGCIRIEAAPLDADHIRLRYGDDGAGIPDAIRHRIFDPFFTTRLGGGGSGLGLYIVYNLVTGVLGGTIQVRGQAGQGATFTLTLPRVAPDGPEPLELLDGAAERAADPTP